MPIYEHECLACGARFEELEAFECREKPHKCPVCGAKRSRPVMSVFAGSGPSCGSCSPSAGKSCGPT
jgi:putative FmdB family regulatory protein